MSRPEGLMGRGWGGSFRKQSNFHSNAMNSDVAGQFMVSGAGGVGTGDLCLEFSAIPTER